MGFYDIGECRRQCKSECQCKAVEHHLIVDELPEMRHFNGSEAHHVAEIYFQTDAADEWGEFVAEQFTLASYAKKYPNGKQRQMGKYRIALPWQGAIVQCRGSRHNGAW